MKMVLRALMREIIYSGNPRNSVASFIDVVVCEVSLGGGKGDGISDKGQRPRDHFGCSMAKNGGRNLGKKNGI